MEKFQHRLPTNCVERCAYRLYAYWRTTASTCQKISELAQRIFANCVYYLSLKSIDLRWTPERCLKFYLKLQNHLNTLTQIRHQQTPKSEPERVATTEETLILLDLQHPEFFEHFKTYCEEISKKIKKNVEHAFVWAFFKYWDLIDAIEKKQEKSSNSQTVLDNIKRLQEVCQERRCRSRGMKPEAAFLELQIALLELQKLVFNLYKDQLIKIENFDEKEYIYKFLKEVEVC